MILYAVILFLTAALFAVLAALIHKGKTELIHDHHRSRVEDPVGYGKAFGKAMGAMAGAMALSGGVALLGQWAAWPAVAVLVIGLVGGIIALVAVQKKYNGGVL